MSSSYQFVIHAEAFRLLLTYGAEERELLSAFFQRIASDPYLSGEYEETDREGRIYQVTQVHRWLVTYYADHAVKEVRIVRVEQI